MSSDSFTVGVGFLYGPMDDIISKEEDGSIVLFSKQEAIDLAKGQLEEILNERLPEDAAFRVYLGASVDGDGGEKKNGEDDGQEF
jgi:hypothetical protein